MEWRRGTRSATPLSIVMIDIDEFKLYNDALGHQRGDECLRRVAGTLAGVLNRAEDLLPVTEATSSWPCCPVSTRPRP